MERGQGSELALSVVAPDPSVVRHANAGRGAKQFLAETQPRLKLISPFRHPAGEEGRGKKSLEGVRAGLGSPSSQLFRRHDPRNADARPGESH